MAVKAGFPCKIARYVYVPGTNPYVFYVDLKAEALMAVGVLERVTDVFARFGIPILQANIVSSNESLRIVVFADVKDEKAADAIARELKNVPYALQTWYSKPLVKGFAYDEHCFPLTVEGERAIIMRRAVYENFFKEGWRQFGTAFPIMLYMLGFEAGKSAYKDHSRIAGGDRKAELKVGKAFFQLMGYGRLEIPMVDDVKREAVYRVYDSFECEVFKGAGEIRSGFVRGLLGGWFAARWGIEKAEDIVVREEKCIAKGDPYCEAKIWVEKKR